MTKKRQVGIFEPNERDVEILKYVADFRFVSIELLAALMVEPPAPGRQYGFSLSALRARCQKLREHNYLVWQFLHDLPTGRGHTAERPMVYSIGPAAVELLVEHHGFDGRQLKVLIEKNVLTSFFLRHFLAISRFRTCLELACRNTIAQFGGENGAAVEIGTWLQDGLVDRVNVRTDDGIGVIPVVPDAVFNLIVHAPDDAVSVTHYALEMDRGSMPQKSITAKATGYMHYLEQGLQKRRYTYYGESGPSQELRLVNTKYKWEKIPPKDQQNIVKYGIDSFTVLFVTRAVAKDVKLMQDGDEPQQLRQRNMMEAVRRVEGFDLNKIRFLFCTEDLDYDLSRPDTLFDSIWQTVGSDADKRRTHKNLLAATCR